MSKIQETYELANAELQAAEDSITQGSSTNHAVLACALYLRSITEMLGVKFNKEDES